ncbi:hypothetical protein ABVC73_01540 [Prevotella melaninogenica]
MDKTRCTITSDYHSLTREVVVKLLEQRDAELEQRDAELEQRDAKLKNKDAELEQRDTELKNKDAELEQRDTELKNKDAELEQRDTELKNKDAELEQRNAELKNKDAELKNKDAELEQREAELKNKDAELKNKDAELERKSRRILELERMVFGRRSEKRLPENASDWTGTLFDEQWAKEVPGSGGSPSHHQGNKTAGRTTQGITPCEPSFQKGYGLRLLCSREHRATGDGDISKGL